jgi:Putative prokaryotic signal transducing protein
MRKVHTAESIIEIAHLRNVLESSGIACEVRNDRLGSVLGEIPFLECWPQLWVRHPGDVLRARGLIDEALRPVDDAMAWQCPGCGERIEAQFAQCWRCAAEPEPSP